LTRIGYDLAALEATRQHGLKAFIVLTGAHSNYTDAGGCFSLSMWKAALDRRDAASILPYVQDGTIIGLYAVDEPYDWGNSCGPSFVELDAACEYAHQQLPGIACGYNAPPAWMAQGAPYQHIDYLFTQSNFQRTQDWQTWANNQLADAAWFVGPLYLSINVSEYNASTSQIQAAGVALCRSQATGVMMWKWPDRFSEAGMREAMAAIAAACRAEDSATATPTYTPSPAP
jgi:hypothetical protein